ncbi:MAG: hypothetical protein ACREMY_19040 [bacterium]
MKGNKMTRFLKLTSLVLAILALSAVAASTALATTDEFGGIGEGEEENPGGLVTLKNTNEVTFGFDLGNIVCKKHTGAGIAEFPTKEITFEKLTYTECEEPKNKEKVTVDINGCHLEYRVIEFNGVAYTGQIDIICPAGKAIEFTLPGCTVTLDEKFGLENVLYHNEGMGLNAEVSVEVGLSGLSYTEDNANGLKKCAHAGVPTNNGTYSGLEKLTNETSTGAMRGLVVVTK